MNVTEHAETLYRAETANGNPICDGVVNPGAGDRLVAVDAVPLDAYRGAVEERDRLRALLKQAHDRDGWMGQMPPIKWYDAVADYFKGRYGSA
jgi:hypothetical protein